MEFASYLIVIMGREEYGEVVVCVGGRNERR
jgi:hypothetical protein